MIYFKDFDFRWGFVVVFLEKIFKRESLICVWLGGLVDFFDEVFFDYIEENGF